MLLSNCHAHSSVFPSPVSTQYRLNSHFVKCLRTAFDGDKRRDKNGYKCSSCGPESKEHRSCIQDYVVVIVVFACDCDVNQMKIENVTPYV